MRNKIAAVVAVLALTVVGFGLFTPADAGRIDNVFTVLKEVEGPVPAGAVFEVEVSCQLAPQEPPTAEGISIDETVLFDETGAPLNDNTFEFGGGTVECTANETVTNGATVSYACEATSAPPEEGQAEGIPSNAECVDDQTVVYSLPVLSPPEGGDLGAEGTVTVTNTFADTPPPLPDDVDDDDVVTATPTFTG